MVHAGVDPYANAPGFPPQTTMGAESLSVALSIKSDSVVSHKPETISHSQSTPGPPRV